METNIENENYESAREEPLLIISSITLDAAFCFTDKDVQFKRKHYFIEHLLPL